MTARSDFTDEEWYRIRSAPWQVAMGVVEVDPSGSMATGKELDAVEDEIRRASGDAGPDLIHLVATAITADNDPGTPPADGDEPGTEPLPDEVLGAMGELRAILDAKVTPLEAEDYRTWLLALGAIAAWAAKEGVAGITGPTVSDAEQAFLDRLREVLGG